MVYKPIREHDRFNGYDGEAKDKRYDKISSGDHPLIEWVPVPYDGNPDPGYYASYNIGAQWVNEDEAIVVIPKMEDIDFLKMFMTCFGSGIEVDSFNEIYEISEGEPTIKTSAFNSVLSPLIVIHFLSVVERIKSLKKGYVHRGENLKKVKGHINILKNERKNIMMKRFDRVFCEYDEYSVDIPENRLIKKALLFAKQVVFNIGEKSSGMGKLRVLMAKDMAMFEQVSAEVEIRDVKQIRGHKLYAEYKEAIRLAKLILRHFDYNISKVNENKAEVVPFVLNMPLLYEHYVLGLLCDAYDRKRIHYQSVGEKKERPDFSFRATATDDFKAVLDTKYKLWYDWDGKFDIDDIRQLSGYGRDLKILRGLGYKGLDVDSPVQDVPCIIIYPIKGEDITNPFIEKEGLGDFCVKENEVGGWARFYKIGVPLPTK